MVKVQHMVEERGEGGLGRAEGIHVGARLSCML